MKKALSLVLALVLCLSLCACGNGNTTPNVTETAESSPSSATEQNVWKYAQIVDEFGDVITDSNQTSIYTSVSGDFSNTATNSSELSGSVFVVKTVGSGSTDWSVYFRLLEYGSSPVTYHADDDLILKIKVDDTIEEYTLTGVAPNGDLRLGEDKIGNNPIYDYLYDGKDVRCVIYIGNSKYNFTVESNGFVNACVEAGYISQEKADIDAMSITSVSDVIESFYLHADSTKRNGYLAEHRTEYAIVPDSELSEMLDGYWMTVATNTWGSWDMYKFSEDGIYVSYGYQDTKGVYHPSEGNGQKMSWYVDNGILYFSKANYEVRKLMDGYYIANKANEDGTVEDVPGYLFIQSNSDGSVVYPYQ